LGKGNSGGVQENLIYRNINGHDKSLTGMKGLPSCATIDLLRTASFASCRGIATLNPGLKRKSGLPRAVGN